MKREWEERGGEGERGRAGGGLVSLPADGAEDA